MTTRRPMHLVIRSSQARGPQSFLHPKHARVVQSLVIELAKQNWIRVYRFANVGNHLHILLRAKNREGFKRFVRVLTGRLAMRVGNSKKGSPLAKKFFDLLPFSRIVEWGRAFGIACRYVELNEQEALGLVRRRKEIGSKGLLPYPRSGTQKK